jgi:replicative DNA helicase
MTDDALIDVRAEQAAVGAALTGSAAYAAVIDVAPASDFGRPVHRQILEACARVVADGKPLDVQTVRAALGTTSRPERDLYLLECVNTAPAPQSGPFYAQQVARLAALRRLLESAMRAQQIALTDGAEPEEAVAYVRNDLDRVLASRQADLSSWADVVIAALDTLDADSTTNLPTGLADLDALLGGYGKGRLTIVAARPGVGKSILLLQGALAAAKQDRKVLIASLELGQAEVGQRLLAAQYRINWRNINDEAIGRAGRGLQVNLPILVDDSPTIGLSRLRTLVAREKPDLLCVDYLQLMQPTDPKLPRHEQVGALSRGLKLLSREFDVAVLAACQTNRQSVNRTDRRPTLADLRESGSIEADADVVILLHDPTDGGNDESRLGETDIIVAKNRQGATGTVPVSAQLHYSRFASLERHTPPEFREAS